jgi:large subunit ribosomal protein L25
MSNQELVLTAEPRTIIGKKVKTLRRNGIVPAVVYGQREPISIQLDRKEARRVLRAADANSLITIETSGKKYTTLVRDVQQHLTRRDILHVDFYEVNMMEEVTTEADLIRSGVLKTDLLSMGQVSLMLRSLEISARPDALISEILVDMGLFNSPDDSILVKDLPIPDGVTVLTDPETPVAIFSYLREEVAEDEDEDIDPTAIEVIGEDI